MSKDIGNLSYCMGVYNEADVVLDQLRKIKEGLAERFQDGTYEIIVVDNGSSDETLSLLQRVEDPIIRVHYLTSKGLGAALKQALIKAKYNWVIFDAIDLPFGFTDLDEAFKHWDDFDLIFGSKSHPDSTVRRALRRNLASFFHRLLLRILFNVKIKDTQGSLFIKRSSLQPFLDYCDGGSAFFTTQIAIYASLFKLRILEIPVVLSPELRISKFNLFKDGWSFLSSMWREYEKYNRIKESFSKTVIKSN